MSSSDLDSFAHTLVGTPATREVIPRDPTSSFRWRVHGYPDPLARWNFHPEYEIHLIRRGVGRYIIGDVVGNFGPGHLVLVGSNLPHDWISDLTSGESIPDRDVVLQFDGAWLARCQEAIPELRELDVLLARSAHGIEFTGATSVVAAERMELIGATSGPERIEHVLGLLRILHEAPPEEYRLLVNNWGAEPADPMVSAVIGKSIQYIFENISNEVRLSTAARLAGMSESAFSRYFKAASGQTFSDMVTKLRLTHACRLLETTTTPIAVLAREVGYANLSNFNRRFLNTYGMTPREYRARHRVGPRVRP